MKQKDKLDAIAETINIDELSYYNIYFGIAEQSIYSDNRNIQGVIVEIDHEYELITIEGLDGDEQKRLMSIVEDWRNKQRIRWIAQFIMNKYNGYQRFYTPTMFQGEISATHEVCGIQIDASHYAEYIDILGLTKDEQNELEVKITELKSGKKK